MRIVHRRKSIVSIMVAGLLTACGMSGDLGVDPKSDLSDGGGSEENQRPNIILILADDLGYGDIGAFGGEIQTPSLDALAEAGVKLTGFHTQASCSPTRSMLLTGVDNHLNGMGTMAEDLLPHHAAVPGYEGHLNQRVITLATLLKNAGYSTHMSGKWHLGFEKHLRPHARGFETSFALLNGTANHYTDAGPNAAQPLATYTRNGRQIERPSGYSSDLFTDELLSQLKQNRVEITPFFAYLSFTAPHWPLQAPRETVEKYHDAYRAGWDKIRSQRFQSMRNLGLVPEALSLPARVEGAPAWETLSPDEQKVEARKMAVYAAMVDNLDANIGRLIDYLKRTGEYENSAIIFMSDNGTDPYDRSERGIYQDWIAENYDNRLENIGNGNSYTFYGPGWAQVGSVHHRYYKFLPTEGGTRSPVIIKLPNQSGGGVLKSGFASILDVVPTALDWAQRSLPLTEFNNGDLFKPRGRSMVPYLRGEANRVYSEGDSVAFELFGHATVYRGDWKAVRIREPWEANRWALFNIKEDPAEQDDRSAQAPELLASLVADYEKYKAENNVLDEPDGVTAYPEKPRYIPLQSSPLILSQGSSHE